jgi:hypothetical protein
VIDLSPIEGIVNSFPDLALNEANIWTIQGGRVAIGIVLLAERKGLIAVVRKDAVTDYEFSDMLALPGGVVRGGTGLSFAQSVEASLLSRAADEAGLNVDNLTDIRVLSPDYVPVSRYTVKGSEQFALVFAARATVTKPVILEPKRRSIREAFFATLPLDWKEIAPANRLILANAYASRIPAEQKIAHLAEINRALAFCNAAAQERGLPLLSNPWRDVSAA